MKNQETGLSTAPQIESAAKAIKEYRDFWLEYGGEAKSVSTLFRELLISNAELYQNLDFDTHLEEVANAVAVLYQEEAAKDFLKD